MSERKVVGVERLTADVFHVRVVEVIPDQGIPKVFHMDTDLMGAACFQTQGNEAVPVFLFYGLIVGDGALPALPVYSTLTDSSLFPGERGCNCAGGRF